MEAYQINTKTANGRIAHTLVFKPEKNIIVIRQRILATVDDVNNGWFTKGVPIYTYKDRVVMQVELTLWDSSFELIKETVEKLK